MPIEVGARRGNKERKGAHLISKLRSMALGAWIVVLGSTPAADALDDAQTWLGLIGMPVPPGCRVQWGTNAQGEMGTFNPFSSPPTITIDAAAMTQFELDYGDGSLGDPTGLPLVVAAIIMHELFHTPEYGGWENTKCHHVAVTATVADGMSDLIDLMAQEGLDVSQLCAMHNAMVKNFNSGTEGSGKGGACDQAAAIGCTESCENLESNSNCPPPGSQGN